MLFIFLVGLTCTQNIEAHSGHKHSTDNPTITLPDIVAQVNGVNITGKNIWWQLKQVIRKHKTQGKLLSASQEKAEAKRLVEWEIERELLLQKWKNIGLRSSPEMVEKKTAKIKASFKSEKHFQKRLTEQEMTLDQFRKKVGMDLLMEAFVKREIHPYITVEIGELKDFYKKNKKMFLRKEQVRASIILIKVNPKAGVEAEKKAYEEIRRILNEIENGKEFTEIAKKYSQDSLASRGGDLGFFTKNRMFGPFSERAFKMRVGEVSEIFKTGHGYQILKVTDKKPNRYSPFEKVKEKIEEIIRRKKVERKTKEYAKVLRKKARVKIYY